MRNSVIIGFCFAFCAVAAQAQPSAQVEKSVTKTSHRAEKCNGRYAETVGKLSYVETRLALSDKQKPLFDRWKNARMTQAKEHEDRCVTHVAKNRSARPTPVERMARQEERLKMRLAQMEAEKPAFTALYASLTPEQQEVFSHLGGQHGRDDENRGYNRGRAPNRG